MKTSRARIALAMAGLLAGHPGVAAAVDARAGWPDVPANFIERSGRGRDPKSNSQKKRRQRAKWSK